VSAWVRIHEDGKVDGKCDACRWHLQESATCKDALLIARFVLMAWAGQLHDEHYCEALPAQLVMDL